MDSRSHRLGSWLLDNSWLPLLCIAIAILWATDGRGVAGTWVAVVIAGFGPAFAFRAIREAVALRRDGRPNGPVLKRLGLAGALCVAVILLLAFVVPSELYRAVFGLFVISLLALSAGGLFKSLRARHR